MTDETIGQLHDGLAPGESTYRRHAGISLAGSLTPQEHKATSVDGSSRAFVREQYGPHRLVRSPDGGCKLCPLSVADEIHADGPAHNPCTRCGHDQPRRCAGDDVPPGRFCLDCPDMTCQPRRVPVGAAQTVTVTDGEEVVE